MAYEKQNFSDGQVLTAEQLNHIEDGIESLENQIGGSTFAWDSYGLPQLRLYGDTSTMTKDNAVALGYDYADNNGLKSGTCAVKWQGTSSIAFPKKNYTIKFDNAFEAYEGWGIQNKYCMKANWVDFSHARNIVSAKLWGQVVKTRHSTKNIFLPNYVGFVDGVQSVNGLTVTANEDGSLTVTGTATAWTHITVQHNLYAGGTNILTNGLNTDNYNDEYVISVVNSNGEYPAGLEWFGYDSNSHMAFIRVNEGDSINDTIYPQIERRSRNNIFSPNYVGFVDGVQSVNGLTVTANADGSLTVMGTATAWTHITVQENLYAGNANILTNGLNTDNYNSEYVISVVNSKGEYPAGLEWFGYDSNSHMAFIRVDAGQSINDTIYPQIVEVPVATPWDAPFSTNTQKLSTLVNGGGVDGFPIVVSINGTYQGIYTFNIPKDGWMFDMGSGTQEGIVCAEGGTYLREQVLCDETDFSIEYTTSEDNTAWISTSVNRLINALNNSDGTDLDTTIAQYLDWDSAIDYFAMSLLFNNFDGYGKNYLLVTYDGTKWLFSAYDMDSTHGLWWNGQEFMSATNHPSGLLSSFRQNKVFDMICLYKKAELMARYTELRDSVLSGDNVITNFANFISRIPKGLYGMEAELWADIPSTAVNNFAQIADFYKRRSAFIDREIENL